MVCDDNVFIYFETSYADNINFLWIEILRTNNVLQSHYKFVRILSEYIPYYGLKIKK